MFGERAILSLAGTRYEIPVHSLSSRVLKVDVTMSIHTSDGQIRQITI